MSDRPRRFVPLAGILAIGLLAAACTGSSGSPAPAATAAVAPSAASSALAAGAPTPFAAWTERQGFGGSSGLRNVLKLANWLLDNSSSATAFDVSQDGGDVAHLVSWLESHPPTPCWTDYHATILGDLRQVSDGYTAAATKLAASQSLDREALKVMVASAQSAFDVAAPDACP